MAKGAETRLRDEMGDDFDAVEWKNLDPRQYDPRRIIRDALKDEPAKPDTSGTLRESAYAQRKRLRAESGVTPYDSEST
jgi:sec-independent protein translocase protein TatB